MTNFTTHEEIAEEMELDPGTARRFVSYMRERWPEEELQHVQTGYSAEWAGRFKAGYEFSASDFTGKAILRRLSIQ